MWIIIPFVLHFRHSCTEKHQRKFFKSFWQLINTSAKLSTPWLENGLHQTHLIKVVSQEDRVTGHKSDLSCKRDIFFNFKPFVISIFSNTRWLPIYMFFLFLVVCFDLGDTASATDIHIEPKSPVLNLGTKSELNMLSLFIYFSV